MVLWLRPRTGGGDDLPGGPGIALNVLLAGAVSVIVLLLLSVSSLLTELPELLPVLGTT